MTKKTTKKTSKKTAKKAPPLKIYGNNKKNRKAPPKPTNEPNKESLNRVRKIARDAILEACYSSFTQRTLSRGCGLDDEAAKQAIKQVCEPILEQLEGPLNPPAGVD